MSFKHTPLKDNHQAAGETVQGYFAAVQNIIASVHYTLDSAVRSREEEAL
jgi:hypothetical protein